MIDELRAKFLTRFLDSAKNRLICARGSLDRGERIVVLHELHALAGEAAILEFQDVAGPARAAEKVARAWAAAPADADCSECGAAIATVETAVAALTEQARASILGAGG